LGPVSFNKYMNCIYGDIASGKSLLLNSIYNLKQIGTGLIDKCEFSNYYKWELIIEINDDVYEWNGEIKNEDIAPSEVSEGSVSEHKLNINNECLIVNKKKVFSRANDITYIEGKEYKIKLSINATLLYLLEEPNEVKVLKKELGNIINIENISSKKFRKTYKTKASLEKYYNYILKIKSEEDIKESRVHILEKIDIVKSNNIDNLYSRLINYIKEVLNIEDIYINKQVTIQKEYIVYEISNIKIKINNKWYKVLSRKQEKILYILMYIVLGKNEVLLIDDLDIPIGYIQKIKEIANINNIQIIFTSSEYIELTDIYQYYLSITTS